jgi:hypothetical protein
MSRASYRLGFRGDFFGSGLTLRKAETASS